LIGVNEEDGKILFIEVEDQLEGLMKKFNFKKESV